ncbi:MAG: hypothetical protein HY744_24120 [Deltaproteobacteria bacterium]|nr:hypothetical protein [Deltaproteobacteria bacterium]
MVPRPPTLCTCAALLALGCRLARPAQAQTDAAARPAPRRTIHLKRLRVAARPPRPQATVEIVRARIEIRTAPMPASLLARVGEPVLGPPFWRYSAKVGAIDSAYLPHSSATSQKLVADPVGHPRNNPWRPFACPEHRPVRITNKINRKTGRREELRTVELRSFPSSRLPV